MTTLAHAFDVETSSPFLGPNRLMSIGACCLEIPRHGSVEVVNSFFVTIDWGEDGLVFDHPVTQKFWDDNPEAFKQSTTCGVSPQEAARALRDHIFFVQQTAERRRAKYVVVTDNAYFDVPWIDWFLCTYAENSMPLRHNYHTGWMSHDCVIDVNQRVQALQDIGVCINMGAFRSTVPHDHHPLHDATGLAEKFAFYKRMTRGIKRNNQIKTKQ
jgi:hypothetical protein